MLVFSSPAFSLGEEILRRDGLPTVRGELLSGGPSGLLLRVEGKSASSIRIPWSSIRSIEPNEPRPQFKQLLENGEKLWRAKIRLLRGDVQLSEPIFATQFKRLLGNDSEDARLAAEGLLRVLIARGAIARAVHPWLETVRLNEIGIQSPYSELQPILDSTTMLCPHLPIIEVERISPQILNSYKIKTNPITSSLVNALSQETTPPSSTAVDSTVEDSLFLSQIVGAASGHPQLRDALRERLELLLPWQKAWAHYAISSGLLRESTLESRNAGLLHLAHVASMNPEIQPWLTGAAMLKLSNELASDGFDQQADRIQYEAIRLFPSHPLLSDVIENKRNTTQ